MISQGNDVSSCAWKRQLTGWRQERGSSPFLQHVCSSCLAEEIGLGFGEGSRMRMTLPWHLPLRGPSQRCALGSKGKVVAPGSSWHDGNVPRQQANPDLPGTRLMLYRWGTVWRPRCRDTGDTGNVGLRTVTRPLGRSPMVIQVATQSLS